jgi:hypothetical protein
MLAFTDLRLRTVWAAADRVPVEKRGVFLERVVALLQLHRGFTDADLDDAARARCRVAQAALELCRSPERRDLRTFMSIISLNAELVACRRSTLWKSRQNLSGRRSAPQLLGKYEARRSAGNIVKLPAQTSIVPAVGHFKAQSRHASAL